MGTGNTIPCDYRAFRLAVHPRGHGEHTTSPIGAALPRGSSPWARGTHHACESLCTYPRFIPVGTGNTVPSGFRFGFEPVHPRGHGEHNSLTRIMTSSGGSSPWARGTLIAFVIVPIISRFIPVGTGNTLCFLYGFKCTAVHPRGHGEHNGAMMLILAFYGSSPWARGTRHLQLCVSGRYRFIPVGTGNTR